MEMVLDLNNFQNPDAEGSRYVLTSPRSLEACARMRVRPVQLLHKPLEDFIEENPGKPLSLLQVFHDEHELKRIELLRKCKEIRKTIIMENKIESKKKKENTEKILAGKRVAETQNKTKSPSSSSFQTFPNRSKTLPRRNNPKINKDKLKATISLAEMSGREDINNNSTEAIYEVIPNSISGNSLESQKNPRQLKKFGQNVPRISDGRATFTKSKSKINAQNGVDSEQPYMISTPKASGKNANKGRADNSWRSLKSDESDSLTKSQDASDSTRKSRSLLSDRDLYPRRRSGSLDTSKRRPRKTSELELASSLKFARSSLTNGSNTPRMQRDQKIVEMMKEKRKRQELEAKRRYEKQQEWEEEKRKEEKKRVQEQQDKVKELRQSQVEWEKRVKEKEEKRVRELKRAEQERLQIMREMEKQLEKNKEEQERLQQAWLDERRKVCTEKKKQQLAARETVELDILAFQEATEKEVEQRLDKAVKAKLERELEEISKIQNMNKAQRKRFLELEKEVKKRKKEEETRKKLVLQEKMEKADILRIKKVGERQQALKLQAKEEDERIQQTKMKQEKILRENEEYHKSITEHKEELLKRANTTAMQNIQEKSKRAQKIRELSQEDQRQRLKQIEKEKDIYLSETKKELARKDAQAKVHLQLKEAAIQQSRANARAAEAARLEVKKKDDSFLEAQKQVELQASIGRGVRTGIVNSSSVKFG